MKNIGKILAALLAIAVMLSFPMLTVSADEGTDAVSDESAEATDTADESSDESAEDSAEDTEKKEDKETTGSSSSSSADKAEEERKSMLLTSGLVTLGIIVIIAVCVTVWALKDKERALKTWRSFKSEFKKVVWADRHQTTKNTILVILAVLVFGAAIGLVDYLFSLGVVGLGKLI